MAMVDDAGIEIVRTISDLRTRVRGWRSAGETVGLVPTMGALHEGHLSLVRLSLTRVARTCVTLFVNPRQFAPNEDLATYPRDEAADADKLTNAGAHLLFAPAPEEMYPEGFATSVSAPVMGDCLEGEFRSGFFTGVATVVAKLLLQAQADIAVFGEKDYQQLLVVRRMVRDLDIPVSIESGPTVREPDGLAISSRNSYLTAEERRVAPALFRTIGAAAERMTLGANAVEQVAWARTELLEAGFAKVDYVSVRDAETLAPVETVGHPARVLAAAWLGRTRLIDNVAVEAQPAA